MTRTLRSVWRLVRIAFILQRHDALAPLQEIDLAPGLIYWVTRLFRRHKVTGRPGEKLARALTELGPSFIKLGQVLSTRADLLGNAVASDLSALQDRLAAFSGKEARETVEAELGKPLSEIFSSFDENALSAASIAQVHLAVTREGKEVAVKVLRPGIERAFERDLEFFTWLADVAEATQPKLRRFKPREVVALFEEQVRLEMDLRMEASAAAELAENFYDDQSYQTPAVDWDWTSRRVFTMERVSGIPMDDREALLSAGHNLEAVLQNAAEIFFKQVFRDGFFHGDQHPGNMFVGENGGIAAVDFGIMGRLDRKTRTYLADMLIATFSRDYRRLAEVHVEAGYLPPGPQVETFAQALRSVCEPIMGKSLAQISFARLLGQLLRLTESFDMPVQPQLLLLQKNMLIAEGVSRILAPELNIWTLAQPMIEGWIRETRGPEARLRETAEDWVERFRRLPETLDSLENAARALGEDGLKINPDTFGLLKKGQSTNRWQILLLWCALGLLALAILFD
jgi:ubiquinone biosynthesis protein